MNIIIGETDLSSITDKYVVLELDTFKSQDQQTVKSFVDDITNFDKMVNTIENNYFTT